MTHRDTSSRISLLLSLAIFLCALSNATEIHFYSEDYPPFNYQEGQKPKGIAVDLLQLMLAKAGMEQPIEDIRFAAWARSYYSALNLENAAVFSTTRNADRETLFKWVGPIMDNRIVIIGKKSRNFSFETVKDLYGFNIGAVRDDIGQTVLQKIAVPEQNIFVLPFPEQAARMLDHARIDLWIYGHAAAGFIQQSFDIDPSDYEVVWDQGSVGQLYYAFNPQVSDTIIAKLQAALDWIKQKKSADGDTEYGRILRKYGYAPEQ